MEGGDGGLEAEPLAELVDDEQRGDLGDAGLDRLEADEVVVELLELVLDAGLVHVLV